jgi:general secretion pathway protein M
MPPSSRRPAGVATPVRPWAAFWTSRTARERQALLAASALVLVAGVGVGLIAPAWHAVQQGPQRHAQLDAQLQQLHALSAQAQRLQAAAPLPRAERIRAVEMATATHLKPSGQARVNGDQLTVSFGATAPEALAGWLADVRVGARLLPDDLQMSRVGTGQALWQGTVLLTLPPG